MPAKPAHAFNLRTRDSKRNYAEMRVTPTAEEGGIRRSGRILDRVDYAEEDSGRSAE